MLLAVRLVFERGKEDMFAVLLLGVRSKGLPKADMTDIVSRVYRTQIWLRSWSVDALQAEV